MGWSELVSAGTWTLIALGLAAVVVLGLGIALSVQKRINDWYMPIVFGLLLYMPVVGTIVTGRSLPEISLLVDNVDPGGLSGWLLRLTTASVVGACLVRILAALFDRTVGDRQARAHGTGLFIAFTLFLVTNHLLNAAFGTRPSFGPDYIYPLIVMAGIYAARHQDPEAVIRVVRDGLLVTMAGSLVAGVIAPDFSVEPKYQSLIPGINFRFWGIGAGPNSLGPTMLVLTLLLLHQPFSRRWLNLAAHVGTLVVFVLAQSKTSWIAAALAVPLLLAYRYRHRQRDPRDAVRGSPVAVPLWWLVPITVVFSAAGLLLAFTATGTRFLDNLLGQELGRLSFTGRDVIWSVVMAEWRENPLFGYGMTMWDTAHRSRIGLPAALSAHNQFLQSLGMAGIIGLAAFIIYFGLLCWYAMSARHATRGLSVALLAVVGIRCLMETPFSMRPILTADFLIQMLLFRLAMMRAERASVLGRQPAGGTSSHPAHATPAGRGARTGSGAVLSGASRERRADLPKITRRANRETHR